jgi:peptide/nickel transport system substrate-binding protein
MYAARLIREAIYDGPIDTVGYTHRPVILEALPSLANGDAVIEQVTVELGDRIVNGDGEVMALAQGMRVRPAGCRTAQCEVPFEGESLLMDRLRATFRLKPDVRWADGTPLTAQDAVYSYKLARDPDTLKGKWLEIRTHSYEAPDPHTVVWTGMPGFLDPDYVLAFWTPLPKHAWVGYTAAELPETPEVTRTPLGYGPYVIQTWEPGQYVRLTPNPHYFRADEGLPFFETLTFRFISNQTIDGALDALADGTCDLLTRELYVEDGLARLQAMAEAGEARMVTQPSPVWEHLTFNVSPPPDYEAPAYFADARTRRAVAWCVDRARILEEMSHGLSTVSHTYLPSEHPLYVTEAITAYSHDPAQGRALLDAAGWRDEDGDGVREAHGVVGVFDGTPLHIRYSTTTSPARERVATLIAQDLTACGFAVEVETLDVGTFFASGAGTPLYGRHFDVAAFSWLNGVHPACELYLSTEISSEKNQWSGQNLGGYADTAYDTFCRQAMGALPSEVSYANAHREAQRVFNADLPALPLYRRLQVFAARPNLLGFAPDPLAPETWNLETFSLGAE